jgi:hypothetical protein
MLWAADNEEILLETWFMSRYITIDCFNNTMVGRSW